MLAQMSKKLLKKYLKGQMLLNKQVKVSPLFQGKKKAANDADLMNIISPKKPNPVEDIWMKEKNRT